MASGMEIVEQRDDDSATLSANETLYINNLNDKVKKNILKSELLNLFRQHGEILDIIAIKTQKMRGQAFIIYNNVLSASNALKALQGFVFYGKPMKIGYAKSKSNVIAIQQGLQPQPRASGNKAKKQKMDDDERNNINGGGSNSNNDNDASKAALEDNSNNPPNHILFAQNLPNEANVMTLGIIFQPYAGFKEARIPPNKNVAFIEFETQAQASQAMAALNGFRMSSKHTLTLSYAKQ